MAHCTSATPSSFFADRSHRICVSKWLARRVYIRVLLMLMLLLSQNHNPLGDDPQAPAASDSAARAAVDGLMAALAGTRLEGQRAAANRGHCTDTGGTDCGESEDDRVAPHRVSEAVRLEHLGDIDGAIELLEDEVYHAADGIARDRAHNHLGRMRARRRELAARSGRGGSGGGGGRSLAPLEPLNVSAARHVLVENHWGTPVVTSPLRGTPGAGVLLREIETGCIPGGAPGRCVLDLAGALVGRLVESVCADWGSATSTIDECRGRAVVTLAEARADAEGDALAPTSGARVDERGMTVAAVLLVAPEVTVDLNSRFLRLRDPREGARVRPYPAGFGFGIPRKVELEVGVVVSFPDFLQRSLPPNPSADPRVWVMLTVRLPCDMVRTVPHRSELMWPTPVHTSPPNIFPSVLLSQLLAEIRDVEWRVPSVHKSNDGGFQSDVDLDVHVAAVHTLRLDLYHVIGGLLARHVGAEARAKSGVGVRGDRGAAGSSGCSNGNANQDSSSCSAGAWA
jgi:hypothetical protein